MNNIFDIKRFGKYFLYDLKNGWVYYGISLLVIGMLPLLVYVICATFSLILYGSFYCEFGLAQKILTLACYVTVVIAYPVKIYGRYTDKKTGANWILLPSSALEKFLSMFLIIVVVLPVAFCGLMSISSGALVLLCGDSVKHFLPMLYEEAHNAFEINGVYLLIVQWIVNILGFALGALVFKKRKIVKTFLCGFLLVMFLMAVIAWCGRTFNFEVTLTDSESFSHFISVFFNVDIILSFILLCCGLFWRISNIKY